MRPARARRRSSARARRRARRRSRRAGAARGRFPAARSPETPEILLTPLVCLVPCSSRCAVAATRCAAEAARCGAAAARGAKEKTREETISLATPVRRRSRLERERARRRRRKRRRSRLVGGARAREVDADGRREHARAHVVSGRALGDSLTATRTPIRAGRAGETRASAPPPPRRESAIASAATREREPAIKPTARRGARWTEGRVSGHVGSAGGGEAEPGRSGARAEEERRPTLTHSTERTASARGERSGRPTLTPPAQTRTSNVGERSRPTLTPPQHKHERRTSASAADRLSHHHSTNTASP